jgi:hypothetical protein
MVQCSQQCRIQNIPDRAFANIGERLSVVALEDNYFNSFGEFAFTGLPTLGHLSMSRNRLTSLGRNALYFTTTNPYVLLHDNFLLSISDHVFGSDVILPNELVLANNLLTTLEQYKWQTVLEGWNEAGGYSNLYIGGKFLPTAHYLSVI